MECSPLLLRMRIPRIPPPLKVIFELEVETQLCAGALHDPLFYKFIGPPSWSALMVRLHRPLYLRVQDTSALIPSFFSLPTQHNLHPLTRSNPPRSNPNHRHRILSAPDTSTRLDASSRIPHDIAHNFHVLPRRPPPPEPRTRLDVLQNLTRGVSHANVPEHERRDDYFYGGEEGRLDYHLDEAWVGVVWGHNRV